MVKIIRKGGQRVMLQEKSGEVEYLTFPSLTDTKIVEHLFSTRVGGVSKGIFASMNLTYTRGDEKASVDENFRRIASVLNNSVDNFVLSKQTHTANVRIVSQEDRGKGITKQPDYEDVDGLITNIPGIVLATSYADCVPLFFVDRVKGVIGLSHSGWRGTVLRMGKVTIEKMQETYGCEKKDIITAIGPSICKDCYEVDEDVAEAFRREFSKNAEYKKIVFPKENGKYQLDLWKANEIGMREAGIPKENIAVTDICTCCNPDYLFSHRATEGKRGNLGAFLVLKEMD